MRCIYFWLLSTFLILQACTPGPVYRMKPKGKHITFEAGTGYLHQQKNGIDFTISYYRHFGKRFVMDVQVVNNTDSIVRVRPGQFSYDAIGCYEGEIPGDSARVIASRGAINPENELLKKDLAISRSLAHQKTSNVIFGVAQALTLAGGLISDSTRAQHYETAEDLRFNSVNHRMNANDRAAYRQGLRGQKKIWEQETIRKTDLFPGDYLEGYVFFRNSPKAFGYVFHYHADGRHFNAFFSQLKFQP